jgi:RHS repeat-associated protein
VYSGDGDTAEVVLDSTGAVVDKTIALIGGVIQSSRFNGGTETKKWQYPNIHGDVVAQADSSGNKIGNTLRYDPFGQPLDGNPDNESGDFDYGWLGQHQRQTEHEGAINVIEMGARQYLAGIGRFLQVDPVEGGSANDYDYCDADPVNCNDLDGRFSCKPGKWGMPKCTYGVKKAVKRSGQYAVDHRKGLTKAANVGAAGVCVATVGFGCWIATGISVGSSLATKCYDSGACRRGKAHKNGQWGKVARHGGVEAGKMAGGYGVGKFVGAIPRGPYGYGKEVGVFGERVGGFLMNMMLL